MKYLLLIAIVFAGYKYYDANASTVVSTGFPLLDKIQVEPITKQEVIDFVFPSLYESCSELSNKNFIKQCNDKLDYQKPFCLKVYNSRSPELFTDEEQMLDRIAALTNCMIDKEVF